jgi:dsDNA-specific endonuclease/ATPase MutS2
MNGEIVERSRELLTPGEVEIEALLSQLQTDREEARAARAEAERLLQQARSQRGRLNAELEALMLSSYWQSSSYMDNLTKA